MNYIDKFLKTDNSDKIKTFLEFCKNPVEIQKNVLANILELNKNCEYGKKFGFAKIKTPEDFKEKIPITQWDFYKEDIKRMEKGEPNIIFSGKPEYFVYTSGTEGAYKLIPESTMGKLAKSVVMMIRNLYVIQKYPEVLKGKVLPLSNSARIGFTESGVPIGTASGLTTENTEKELIDKYNVCPFSVKDIKDTLANDYATMRFAIEQDVRGITGNNIGRLLNLVEVAQKYADEIIKDIENGTLSKNFNIEENIRESLKPFLKPNKKKAELLKYYLEEKEKFKPHIYWPNMKIIRCWLAGSIGQYVHKAKKLLDEYDHEVIFIDSGYGASEGKFNIPLKANTPSAPVAMFGIFYEFIDADKDTEETRFLWELEDQKEYKIIITNYSGLYRYDLHDIIRVNGFTYETPNIEFVSKTGDIANICGEKISAEFLVKIFTKALSINNTEAKHFCVYPDTKEARYIFFVEPVDKEINYDKLIKTIESLLYKHHDIYKLFRGQNLLNHPKIVKMKKGWQEILYKEKAKTFHSISQVKLPVVCKTKPDFKWIDKEF